MIKELFSRYRPRYVRSLVYMLQATEYNIGDYLAWLGRTRNFSAVEKRKRLVKTPKARIVLLLAWAVLIVLFAAAIRALWIPIYPFNYIIALFVVAASPVFLAYGLIIPLFILQIIIQTPLERLLILRARKKLERHTAVKIAVAGSFGKTSMREILKTVLSEGKKVAAPPHSYNTPLGVGKFINTLRGDEDALIFELGEYYPGDVRKLCNIIHPDIGVVTGVNEAHLQKFKSLERTVLTIFELAEYLGERPVYVNGENVLAKERASSRHILYSRAGVGEWRIGHPRTDLGGTSFTMARGGVKLECTSKLLGLHQVGALAAAADISLRLGLTPDQVRRGVEKTRPFDHRLEPKTDSSGVTTLDDSYNGNPDGVNAVIDFLASLTGHRRFYVTPGLVEMGKRTEAVHKEIGRKLADAGIEHVILVRNSVTPYIEAGLKEAGYRGGIRWFDDALELFSALPSLTVKGDVVLLQNDWPDQYA